MDNSKTKIDEKELGPIKPTEITPVIQQEMHEIKEAVSDVVSETSLPSKVEELRIIVENISEDVQNWKALRKDTYIESLETVKSQLEEIQNEWGTVSTRMRAQIEKLESLLESSPGIIEASTLRALSLRVTHLEKLVSGLVEESNAKSTASRARKQLIISLVALGVTVVLWSIFFVINVLR